MISILLCTRNRAGLLRRTLEAFFDQPNREHVPHEVIVVDNGSNDHTQAVLDAFPTVRCLHEPQPGLSRARNAGIAAAKGSIIACLDDDVLVCPEWLEAMADAFDTTHAHAVGGRATLLFEANPPPWLRGEFRRALSEVDYGGERRPMNGPGQLFGLNLAFRRDAIENAGGFNEQLGRKGQDLRSGEEHAILAHIAATGGSILYEPRAAVQHIIGPERLDWDYFARLTRAIGRSRVSATHASRPGHALRALIAAAKWDLYNDLALTGRLVAPDAYWARFACHRAAMLAEMAKGHAHAAFATMPPNRNAP